MRESLDAGQHPEIQLTVQSAEAAGTVGDTVHARVRSTLTIHGISRPLTVPVAIVKRTSGFVVRASFPIDVRDYQVSGLRHMLGMLKVDPMVTVRAELTFQSVDPIR